MQGSIPWVPYLRAPYYVWVGRVRPLAQVVAEPKVEAPPCFPPTFLYTQSWEDPRPDMQVTLKNKEKKGTRNTENPKHTKHQQSTPKKPPLGMK